MEIENFDKNLFPLLRDFWIFQKYLRSILLILFVEIWL